MVRCVASLVSSSVLSLGSKVPLASRCVEVGNKAGYGQICGRLCAGLGIAAGWSQWNRLGFDDMESPARQISLVPPPDRRQSETALAIARGTARLLRSLGFSCVSELPLPSGRRADLVALNEQRRDLDRRDQVVAGGFARRPEMAGLPAALRPAVLCLHAGPALRDLSRRHRPDRRRRLWRAPALRGARASPAGGDAQIDDGALCDGRRATDQPPGRSAGAWGILNVRSVGMARNTLPDACPAQPCRARRKHVD